MKLRTETTQKAYEDKLATLPEGCIMCSKVEQERYGMWSIVQNDYKYDVIAEKHDMLVVHRHIKEVDQLSVQEIVELANIISWYKDEYDSVLLNMERGRSIPGHLHFHLLKYHK
jgi:hypothetical protein